jgi:2-phosphosulfolactate phosphatase
MNVDVVLLPRDLSPDLIEGRSCAVFDVLRATSTMTAALAAGVEEIRLFDSIESARSAAKEQLRPHLLCGEQACLRPPGFDLGNSPGQFDSSHRARTLLMATTNGTRALLAARKAAIVLPAALINRSAVVSILRSEKRDVTLLCAGTGGKLAMEDVLGAGSVIDALGDAGSCASDTARMALQLFRGMQTNLPQALRQTQGGKNILAAGLDADIDFAARIDSFDAVGTLCGEPLAVRRYSF